jgi:hypothetical protein
VQKRNDDADNGRDALGSRGLRGSRGLLSALLLALRLSVCVLCVLLACVPPFWPLLARSPKNPAGKAILTKGAAATQRDREGEIEKLANGMAC